MDSKIPKPSGLKKPATGTGALFDFNSVRAKSEAKSEDQDKFYPIKSNTEVQSELKQKKPLAGE